MTKCLKSFFFLALLPILAAPVTAQEVVLGGGAAHFEGGRLDQTATAQAEYHFPAFDTRWATGFSWAVAAEAGEGAQYWLGAGVAAKRPFAENWFIEASLMPGIGTDDFGAEDASVQIRALIGVGRKITRRASLSLALSHREVLGGDAQPDADTLSLRLGWRLD